MGKKDKKKKKDKKHSNIKRARDEIEEEYQRKKARKEALKAAETPEERRARRLAKKLKKDAQREAQSRLFDYSNDNNPFRDKNLTKMFIWKKKYEKEIGEGKDPRTLTRENMQKRQMELQAEIEDLKERRKNREQETLELEQMREEQERMNAMADHEDFVEKEEEFQRMQSKVRSDIRIREGREKAIDVLAKNLRISTDKEGLSADVGVDLDVELAEPYKIFIGLEKRDLLDLRDDIHEMCDLKENMDYWGSLKIVCDDEVENLDIKEDRRRNKYGINSSVQGDISNMLEEKSQGDLKDLRPEIVAKLKNGGIGVDVAYWEALLKMLNVFEAKASLNDFHQALLQKRLSQLREQAMASDTQDWGSNEIRGTGSGGGKVESLGHTRDEDSNDEEGGFSPELLDEDELEGEGLDVIDEDMDRKQLDERRKEILEQVGKQELEVKNSENGGKTQNGEVDIGHTLRAAGMNRFSVSEMELLNKEESKGMGQDEAKFAVEFDTNTPSDTYWWHDKYRPRKPRYFNRVRTGFEWNKYNQTHYDKETPPPKVVQGYKFNIFYPDLIDKSKSPTYTLHEFKADPMYSIITFKAGPPYEDIAFKIVQRKWEFGHKRGFKCKFERGVLYLYFNFSRVRYRR